MEDWNGGWVKMFGSNFILFFFLEDLDFLFPPLPDSFVIIGSFLLLPLSPQLKSLKYYDQFFIRIYIFVQKWLTYVIMANSKGPGMYIYFC